MAQQQLFTQSLPHFGKENGDLNAAQPQALVVPAAAWHALHAQLASLQDGHNEVKMYLKANLRLERTKREGSATRARSRAGGSSTASGTAARLLSNTSPRAACQLQEHEVEHFASSPLHKGLRLSDREDPSRGQSTV